MSVLKPLRVAVVSDNDPSNLFEPEGFSRLLREFALCGHHLDIYSRNPGQPSRTRFPSVWQFSEWRRSARPDVVHLSSSGPLGWAALTAARGLGIPVTSMFQGISAPSFRGGQSGWRTAAIDFSIRAFHNRVDLTIVRSSVLKHELSNRGFFRLRVLERGIDTALFNPQNRCESLRSQWQATPESIVFLCPARFVESGNGLNVIGAFEALRDRSPRARLVLIGNLADKGDLKPLPRNITLAGEQEGLSLARHYASADVFLFPDCSGADDGSMLEALASGLPSIAFRPASGADLIVSGVNGELVEADNPRAFTDSIIRWAAHASIRSEMRAHARSSSINRDWLRVTTQFESMIRSLIEGELAPNIPESIPRLRALTSPREKLHSDSSAPV